MTSTTQPTMTLLQRLLGATLLAAVATLFAGVGAAEAQPARSRAQESFGVDFGEDLCGFPLTAHAEMKTTTKTFLDGEGRPVRGITTGPISVWFTNGTTGRTERVSIPGPTFFDAEGVAVRGTGAWATFTADGRFVWAAGHLELDASNSILSMRGTSREICDLVA